MFSSKEVRQLFLDFFTSKKHQIKPSSPIVSKDDPSLLFANAGMNQFKGFFLGNEVPEYRRVANTQKCLRVSGKHNDLEEVGHDTYHHTMFEMLGNWSFGDYFKKEAIEWAWELLTKIYKIPEEGLYVTVFEGDASDGLAKDEASYDFWKRLVPTERILYGNKKDNFWEMGDQGPCGPCSEIHIDLRPEDEKQKTPGAALVNTGHPQVVEIWNLVFMEFNRRADGSLEKLPEKHVDTGMGFERLCMALQGKSSSYDTDVFTPLIREIEVLTGFEYGQNPEIDIAFRVIADHVRAVSFAIADGQLPSNNGAGYVIRRILRRAVRYSYTFLHLKEPFIYRLTDILVAQFKEVFPEIHDQKNLIANVIKEEEHSFLRTLGQGLNLLENIVRQSASKTISGEKAFELYDTFGFPIDLTELILREKGYSLDRKGFEKELRKQKERSKSADKIETSDWNVVSEDEKGGFIGYDHLSSPVKITRYRKISHPKQGDMYQLVFDKTPFYAESGGQVGDKGYLESSDGDVAYIIDAKKENNLVLHLSKTLPKRLEDTFTAVVDSRQRFLSSANHSATHLLHQALRSILGEHVEQKGSMVHSAYLRFDFSHFAKLTDEELSQVEQFVNARIREQIPLEERRNVPINQALQEGVIAFFGEKYGDLVRCIRFGKSFELCGGTHVKNTGDIRHFVIISETAIAAGVRRIEAIASETAIDHLASQSEAYDRLKETLKTNDPNKAILGLQEQLALYKKLNKKLVNEKKSLLYAQIKSEMQPVGDVSFMTREVDLDPAGMKELGLSLSREIGKSVIVLAVREEGKAYLNCFVSKDMVTRVSASELISKISGHIAGKGGGQEAFAAAAGTHPEGIPAAFAQAKSLVHQP